MSYIKKLFDEKNIHIVFYVSLVLKGIFALVETIGGILAYLSTLIGSAFFYFVSVDTLNNIIKVIVREELTEDPKDFLANYVLHLSQNLSLDSLHFVSLYLISHGVIKLWLIIGLLRKKLWYYPTAIVVFVLFIIYQLYRFSFTHSISLLLITLLDIIVIALTWHEYRFIKNRKVLS